VIPPQKPRGPLGPLSVFALIFCAIWLLHLPVLRLPYFWDEAGYFIPAARDLLLSGDPIPQTTLTTSHPPLVPAWLALWWKLSNFVPSVTRTAMLLVSAFCLAGVYRLAQRVANTQVAAGSVVLTALYPVFFAQSSLAHLDVAAAAFTMWGLVFYTAERWRWCAAMFALAALAKETAIIAPLALIGWEVLLKWWQRLRELEEHSRWMPEREEGARRGAGAMPYLAASLVPLVLWFAYQGWRTGHPFGEASYVGYNLWATLHPVRFGFAIFRRVWQAFGYMNLFALTAAALLAMMYAPVRDGERKRARIAIPTQLMFAGLVGAYGLVLSLLGGAVLARYMLPVVPLVIIVWVSTVWRRSRRWLLVLGLVAIAFVAGWWINPPYPFAPEDNLSYRDFVLLHQRAAQYIADRHGNERVLTAWPASDELSKPYLGYVPRPIRVVTLENFSPTEIARAAGMRAQYDVVLMFSTKYEPGVNLFDKIPFWETISRRYFDYHRNVPPDLAAALLQGKLVKHWRRGGQWVAVIEIERAESASLEHRRR